MSTWNHLPVGQPGLQESLLSQDYLQGGVKKVKMVSTTMLSKLQVILMCIAPSWASSWLLFFLNPTWGHLCRGKFRDRLSCSLGEAFLIGREEATWWRWGHFPETRCPSLEFVRAHKMGIDYSKSHSLSPRMLTAAMGKVKKESDLLPAWHKVIR